MENIRRKKCILRLFGLRGRRNIKRRQYCQEVRIKDNLCRKEFYLGKFNGFLNPQCFFGLCKNILKKRSTKIQRSLENNIGVCNLEKR